MKKSIAVMMPVATVLFSVPAYALVIPALNGGGSGPMSYNAETLTFQSTGTMSLSNYKPRFHATGNFELSLVLAAPMYRTVDVRAVDWTQSGFREVNAMVSAPVYSLNLTVWDNENPEFRIFDLNVGQNKLNILEKSYIKWYYGINGDRNISSGIRESGNHCSNTCIYLDNNDIGGILNSDYPDFSVGQYGQNRRLSFRFSMPGMAAKSDAAFPENGFINSSYDGYMSFSFGVTVPEPATWVVLIVGFGLIGCRLRHMRRAQVQS